MRAQDNCKIVAHSSSALTYAEKNYSQHERECLVIVYGCEINRLYLLGRSIAICIDRQPILSILNKPKNVLLLCIEHLILLLQGYGFNIADICSNENISYYFSRHPFAQPQEKKQYLKEYNSFFGKNACPKALTLDDKIFGFRKQMV